MHAKLFVELGVEVGSGLALILTQLNGSLAAMQESLGILASHCRRSWLAIFRHSMFMRDRAIICLCR
jgi:hypothetical protein